MVDKRIGIYVCSGCEIGRCIATEELLTGVSDLPEIIQKKCHHALCQSDGIERIGSAISSLKINGVIIAACSPRVNTDVFNFGSGIQTERVNLREQVAWCNATMNEDTQSLAADSVNMAVAKIRHTDIPKPMILQKISSAILVVGGGITGITAAIEGAKTGYDVILVEQQNKLGGRLTGLHKQIPVDYPYDTLIDPVIHEKIDTLMRLPNVKVYTSTSIRSVKGQPGDFEIILSDSEEIKVRAGAIIASMGWKPYDAARLDKLGYGKYPDVITGVELEEMAMNGKICKPSDGRPPEKVLFIQCAGSRDKEHLPYCSSYCCATSLKQTRYIREAIPDALIYVIYKDIRTPGLAENFYKQVTHDELLFMTKGEISDVSVRDGMIMVTADQTLLGEKITIPVDMVVLATGMTPAGTLDLNLQYRQGKGLPELKYQFPDSHFICFPYETRRTGIYAAGALRAPMDSTSCMEDAAGAMLKAIQCIESVKRGEAVHPRSGDITYPDLYLERCTDCKRCTEECPFGSYDETEKGTPLSNPTRCRRCGICLGSCPERIINFADYSINSVSQMIKSVSIPDEFENKPRILAFVCENDAYPAFDLAGINRLNYSPFVRIIPVRCLGSVNKVWISDALSKGFDGILQIGCKPGDNYQCHFIHGSELTEKRGENISETLQTMMLEPERIRTVFLEITDYNKIPGIINAYVEEIEMIGPNPFKGM